MGHDISAVIKKKDFEDYSKTIASISTNSNNRAIDYLYLALRVPEYNNHWSGNASIHKFDTWEIERALKRIQRRRGVERLHGLRDLKGYEKEFVETEITAFLRKILITMNKKVWILFG